MAIEAIQLMSFVLITYATTRQTGKALFLNQGRPLIAADTLCIDYLATLTISAICLQEDLRNIDAGHISLPKYASSCETSAGVSPKVAWWVA